MFRIWVFMLVVALGLGAGVLLIMAGTQLQSHGQNMVDIQSKATAQGDAGTIAEVYYNEDGYCNKAYGLAAIGAGVAVIAASVVLAFWLPGSSGSGPSTDEQADSDRPPLIT